MKAKRLISQKRTRDRAGLVRSLWVAGRVCLMFGILLSLTAPVQAEAPGQGTPTDGIGKLNEMFKKLAGLFIQAAFSLMFILFAVGSVKNGLGAQWAHQFGIAHRLSDELLNLAGGVIIFALGLLTLSLANMVMNNISDIYDKSIDIPDVPEITVN